MPAGVSAYVPLANITLGSSVTSITFSSISGIYQDLILVAYVSSSSDGDFWVQFNNDTGSNYNTVTVGGNGTSAYSGLLNSGGGYNAIVVGGANFTTSDGIVKMNVLDYSATDKHKTTLTRTDKASAGTEASAGRWANTSAITSLKIVQYNTARFFTAGSTFALYGVSA
jgi:hypothetical protein